MKEKNKKSIVLMIVAVIVLIVAVMGAAFAYFRAQGGGDASTNIDVSANTTDNLAFTAGDPISIEADQTSFGENAGNITDSSYARATLIANDAGIEAKYNYYVYLDLTKNELVYTTDDEKVELLLKVTGPDGAVTSIDGLTYNSSLGGFDITGTTGEFLLANNYEISAINTTEVQNWNVEITLINLDSDQQANTNKKVSATLTIQKESRIVLFADHIKGLYTTDGVNSLYLHDADLENGANDGSYRYAGASEDVNNFVCFASDAENCPDDNLYRIIGVFGDNVKLIKSDYATSAQLGIDGDYYRAYTIGSDEYKGSNYINIASYYWDLTNEKNVWANSALNTVNLNTNYIAYLNGINTKWANMIAETTWKVGGNTSTNIISSQMNVAYKNEIVNPAENTTYTDEIGLMYVSDYGYAATPTYWIYLGYGPTDIKSAKFSNWMYMGLEEWTITRIFGSSSVVYVSDSGNLKQGDVGDPGLSGSFNAVRPAFYLKPTVKYSSVGDGSKGSPYRIIL